jgi:thiol-disulfide isomerase/thioredoxin
MQKICLVLSVVSIVLIITVLGALSKIESRIASIERKLAPAGEKIALSDEPARTLLEQQRQIVQKKRPGERPVVGKPFGALEFTDLNGKTVTIEALKGKVVLVDFWATWCGPCTGETPNLLAVYEEFKDKGLEIIGISLDVDRRKLDDYIEQHRIRWPNYYDGKRWDNAISKRFGVNGIPQIVLIDREGIVRQTNLRGERIREAVAELIEGAATPQAAPEVVPADWKDEYIIELKGIENITTQQFGVNWFRPHVLESILPDKPDFIQSLPPFKHQMQRYLTFRLGNAEGNRIFAIADFDTPDRKYFPFDLYLDKNRDGNLVDDYIPDSTRITGIEVPYSDGTVEPYSLYFYSFSGDESFGFAYQVLAGRYGSFPVGSAQMQLLVIDNNGNGNFNDSEEVLLMDWDLDGKINGSHQADEKVPLYSVLKLPGASYKIAEFDPPGRRMVLQKVREDTNSPAEETRAAQESPDTIKPKGKEPEV